MKKIIAVISAITLCLGLAACGRRKEEMPTGTTAITNAPTSAPATRPTVTMTQPTESTILPTIETNIPDPEVDTRMPEMSMESTRDTGK